MLIKSAPYAKVSCSALCFDRGMKCEAVLVNGCIDGQVPPHGLSTLGCHSDITEDVYNDGGACQCIPYSSFATKLWKNWTDWDFWDKKHRICEDYGEDRYLNPAVTVYFEGSGTTDDVSCDEQCKSMGLFCQPNFDAPDWWVGNDGHAVADDECPGVWDKGYEDGSDWAWDCAKGHSGERVCNCGEKANPKMAKVCKEEPSHNGIIMLDTLVSDIVCADACRQEGGQQCIGAYKNEQNHTCTDTFDHEHRDHSCWAPLPTKHGFCKCKPLSAMASSTMELLSDGQKVCSEFDSTVEGQPYVNPSVTVFFPEAANTPKSCNEHCADLNLKCQIHLEKPDWWTGNDGHATAGGTDGLNAGNDCPGKWHVEDTTNCHSATDSAKVCHCGENSTLSLSKNCWYNETFDLIQPVGEGERRCDHLCMAKNKNCKGSFNNVNNDTCAVNAESHEFTSCHNELPDAMTGQCMCRDFSGLGMRIHQNLQFLNEVQNNKFSTNAADGEPYQAGNTKMKMCQDFGHDLYPSVTIWTAKRERNHKWDCHAVCSHASDRLRCGPKQGWLPPGWTEKGNDGHAPPSSSEGLDCPGEWDQTANDHWDCNHQGDNTQICHCVEAIIVQAETGNMTDPPGGTNSKGISESSTRSGAHGNKYVDWGWDREETLDLTVSVNETGRYRYDIRYMFPWGQGYRPLEIKINDEHVVTVFDCHEQINNTCENNSCDCKFHMSANWNSNEWNVYMPEDSVELKEGENHLVFTAIGDGRANQETQVGPHIDELVFYKVY
jgi:hypothetical protein